MRVYLIILLHYIILLENIISINSISSRYEFVNRPQNVTVVSGNNVALKCAVTASNTKFDSQSQWSTNEEILLGFHDSGILPGYGGRYSYERDSPGELNLKIFNVSLEDDGVFECQMIRPPASFFRSPAYVNVLVPPKEVYFEKYNAGILEVVEDTELNITCVGGIAKPVSDLNIFLGGKKIVDNIHKWTKLYDNKTTETYLSWTWKAGKGDHNNIISCEVAQQETNTSIRTALTLQIDLIGASDQLVAGQNVSLLCSVEGGNPPPQLTWSKNAGVKLDSPYQYDFTNQVFFISYFLGF